MTTDLAIRDTERARLTDLERSIARGLATFVEVGEALMEIRDSRLYRESHPTFEDYCRERWQFSRQRANQLVDAANVLALTTTVVTAPANEAQARELTPLLSKPEQLREAWAEVVELHPQPTAQHVREVVGRKMGVHYSSATPEWETPPGLFQQLDREFGFEVDVCATAENAKCERYFTPELNGLKQLWRGVCWMNPPYGDEIVRWVLKAFDSAQQGATVVCLVPARVDTGWWWDYCRHGEIRFLRGRLHFGGGASAAPFPSAVVIFPREPRVIWWERAT